jgi:hypothetical protein
MEADADAAPVYAAAVVPTMLPEEPHRFVAAATDEGGPLDTVVTHVHPSGAAEGVLAPSMPEAPSSSGAPDAAGSSGSGTWNHRKHAWTSDEDDILARPATRTRSR